MKADFIELLHPKTKELARFPCLIFEIEELTASGETPLILLWNSTLSKSLELWTQIDCEGEVLLQSGFHVANRMRYVALPTKSLKQWLVGTKTQKLAYSVGIELGPARACYESLGLALCANPDWELTE